MSALSVRAAAEELTRRCRRRALYSRAIGYSYDAEKIFCDKNGKVTRVPCREHVPPDVTACIFWRPRLYRVSIFHVPEALLSAAPFFVVAAEPIDGAKSRQIMGRTPLA